MTDKYILNDKGEPIACGTLLEWARWFETSRGKRIVKQESIGECFISTVFLGLDHNFGNVDLRGGHGDAPRIGSDAPILWETMTFGGGDEIQRRCGGSREQAEAMHREVVSEVQARQQPKRNRVITLE